MVVGNRLHLIVQVSLNQSSLHGSAGPMTMWVQSPALLSGFRISCCCELWCGSQTQLRSHMAVAVAVAVAVASSYGSEAALSWGTSLKSK